MDHTTPDVRGEAFLARVMRPLLLLAPLTLGFLVAGGAYGWRSSSAAADVDAGVDQLVVGSAGADRLNPSAVCADAPAGLVELRFRSLDMSEQGRKTSLSGIGFDRATIDLPGQLERPEIGGPFITSQVVPDDGGDGGTAGTGGATVTDDAAPTGADVGEDQGNVRVELRRDEDSWCVLDVDGW